MDLSSEWNWFNLVLNGIEWNWCSLHWKWCNLQGMCSTGGVQVVLHGLKGHKSPFKALIAAEYNGVQVKLVNNFKLGVTNKSPKFLKLNPIGKVMCRLQCIVAVDNGFCEFPDFVLTFEQ
ncbi:hypothetical protein Patl1_36619 [Pistacia atlantica]|nr:hypothetical protein Patl1_36619 [Pistacia atlantica]